MARRVSPSERLRAQIDELFVSDRELASILEEVARLSVRLMMQSAIEAEVDEFLGRARNERRNDEDRRGSRNGHSPPAAVKTTMGPVELSRPKLRGTDEAFCSRLFGAGVTRTNALESLVISGWVRGLSHRDIEAGLAEVLGPESALSRSTVSRICQRIGAEFEAWRTRDLSGVRLDYLFLDASHFKMHLGAPAEPVLAAWGIDTEGRPVFVGLAPAGSESTDAWDDFLANLKQRGLWPPLLAISDGAPGLIRALERAFATSLRQRCLVHRARNTLAKVSAHDQDEVKADFWAIFDVGDADPGNEAVTVATRQAAAFATKWKNHYPSAVGCVIDDLASLTVHLRFPAEHWRRIRHSNFISVNRPRGSGRRSGLRVHRPGVVWAHPGLEHNLGGLPWSCDHRGWTPVTMWRSPGCGPLPCRGARSCSPATARCWSLRASDEGERGAARGDGRATRRRASPGRLVGRHRAGERVPLPLGGPGVAPATVRAYAFDLVNFARFLDERGVGVADVVPTDVFEWIDWQSVRRPGRDKVVSITAARASAPASVNRRTAAVRAFFEHQVLSGTRQDNPVPAPRRGQGLRPKARGMLGHLGPSRPRHGGRLVRQPRILPESLEPADVSAFLADLATHRDRAMVLLMVFGGLRAAEVRSVRLADVDQGRRQVHVLGKGGRERTVPVERAFFAELAAYLRGERPPGLSTPECFVVLRGPTAGRAMTEAGMRSVFRYHRHTSGATRVRPHRLRHTYGTELAGAGIDLLVLRELMGHASPETTAGYVHLSDEHVAAEYAAARAVIGG